MKSLFSVLDRLREGYDRHYVNAFYTAFKVRVQGEFHDMDTDDIRAILVDGADYVFSAAHDFLDDVAAGARVAVSAQLAGATITAAGGFDTNDFVWPAVAGDQSENIVLYNHNGNGAATDAARQLVCFYDTGMTGMPVTPSGGDINVTVNASGWYTL